MKKIRPVTKIAKREAKIGFKTAFLLDHMCSLGIGMVKSLMKFKGSSYK